MARLFIHGLEGSSQGTKGRYFAEHFPGMLTPDFTGDLGHRMAALAEVTAGHDDLVLVGSSFGGLMAALFTLEHPHRVRRQILLAPALNFLDAATWQGRHSTVPTMVYVGEEDTVTPAELLEPVARAVFADLVFKRLPDDHRLHHAFPALPWSELLA